MHPSNSAVHNGIWNALSNVFTMLAGFVSSILIVRSLSPELYGTYSYYIWLASILSALGSLGFPNALNKFIAELRGKGRARAAMRLIRWTAGALLLLNLTLSVVVVVLALRGAAETQLFLLIAAAVPLINVFVAIPSATLMGFERFRPLSIATSAGGIFQMVLVALAFFNNWGVTGYLIAVLSINLLLALSLTAIQVRGFKLPDDEAPLAEPRPLREILAPFLAFVIPATLYHTVFNSILWHRPEVFFLERMSSFEQVGFFNLAFTVFNILLVLGWALVNGFYPAISRAFGADDWTSVRRHVGQGMLLASVFTIPFTFGAFATLDQLIRTIYGVAMLPAVPVGYVLLLGLLPGVTAGVLGFTLNAVRRPWLMVGLSGVVAVVKMVLVLLLVPPLGASGAAWSTTVAAFGAVILEYVVLNRMFRIQLDWRLFAGLIVIGAVATYALPVAISFLVPGPLSLLLSIPLAGGAYLLALWRFGYLRRLDLEMGSAPGERLRILHILGERKLTPDPETSGMSGIMRAVMEVARHQAALGHDVWVASVGPKPWRSEWEGITLVVLPPVRWAKLRLGRRTFDFSGYLFYVWLTFRTRFDVIHGHFNNYMRFLRAGVRIAHFHGDPFYEGDGAKKLNFLKPDFDLIAQQTDAQVGITRFVARQLERGFGERGNVHVVYNGVDTARFDPALGQEARFRWRHAWGVPDDATVFLYAGAIAPEKGVHHLAAAFVTLASERDDIHLAVAGSGNLWRLSTKRDDPFEEYTRTIQQILLSAKRVGRVHLLGNQPAADMPGIYAAGHRVGLRRPPRDRHPRSGASGSDRRRRCADRRPPNPGRRPGAPRTPVPGCPTERAALHLASNRRGAAVGLPDHLGPEARHRPLPREKR
jgi:O-antigen/teichoic acid export membrane protein/glycosyltransferase involved in cell wall biosynthesis